MRKVSIIGSVIILALSLMVTGTILAQDDSDDTNTDTAWLGISFAETDEGVTVMRVVADSPAETGGLLVDDVIVSLDDEAIESAAQLTELVQAHQPGDVISITVKRDNSESTFEIELGSSPVRRHHSDTIADMDPMVMAEKVLHVELDAVDDGYQVLAGRGRSEDSLTVGDIITAVNGTPVTEVDWQTLLTELADEDEPVLTLTVQRDGEEITVDIERISGNRERGSDDNHGGKPNRDQSDSKDGSTPGKDSTDSESL